ncbi:tRNA preQ1(34) S-adenosylmethionine ribosyltransferase-isomerase QueA [Desulfovibrio litoralis]|uniref:S-adenosylmethionine:tRNA ribosyltransferase-isomerase n=1 Tax=Desulfovibrio litoralis DSM 11393 TaxID=1121455 RepID=A0A1M7TD12_9BACT|nr:tRNA preQ1(34) S-adenosylmethionine ribosyltransferase-isomerase QueA [Desulfovibrio litoralis]SHN68664.1 S-adenosylmethionine--tRNA ribosyltransferase-isomerase [Desulfovibrio litoralis DSM 11393]
MAIDFRNERLKKIALDNSCVHTDGLEIDAEDFQLSSYDFNLPESLVAQTPDEKRDNSKLLVLDRKNNELIVSSFNELASFLPSESLIVTNNVKVAPLRLKGVTKSGGRLEFLLLTPLPLIDNSHATQGKFNARVEGLMRNIKKFKVGETYQFNEKLKFTILEKQEFGRCIVNLEWEAPLTERLNEQGSLPLPPYIKRELTKSDTERYQTIFAKDEKIGSAAAPTAGLHFTPALKAELLAKGHSWTELTLYVGYGTFSPVRSEDIREHLMHSEYFEINEKSAELINNQRANKKPVVAIGTTSTRTLEGVFAKRGKIEACTDTTNIFVYPGKKIEVVDHLITNFHLPKSSLLMLVSAFVGRKRLLSAYEKAIEERLRFFSYGDAMLIL